MDTKRGAQLGKYSLVAEIARGGMGIIFLAQALGRHGFKKLVVVKQLKPDLAEDEKFREMFLDEARLAARLNHRNIVQTIEVDQDGDRYFFVMEYLEGRTLHHVSRLKGEKAISTGNYLRVICDMLAGLHYAHELADYDGTPLNVVHRDVSPRNVFLTYDGQVKLLDFGVAKASGRNQETEAGELKGRVPYMAPEHVSEQKVDRRADIFSAGVLLREALTNKRVWEGHNEIEILRELLQKRIPPMPADTEISDEARAIVEKAMAPERDDRYRTAHEMRSALEQYVSRLDPTGSLAKLGEHISREFAEQREHVKVMIEKHVSAIEAGALPPEAALPTLPISSPDLLAATPAGGTRSDQGSQPRRTSPSSPTMAAKPSSNPIAVAATSTPPPPQPSSSSAPGGLTPTSSNPLAAAGVPSSSNPIAPAAPSSGALPAATAPKKPIKDISIPPPPPPSNLSTYVLLGLGFVVVVVGLTAVLLSTREPDNTPVIEAPTFSPTPTERPGTKPSASASVKPPDDTVEVTINASPPIAQIWIDDVSVGEGPHTAKYKKGSKHYIRAAAPGFVTKTEAADFNATASMNIVLEREAGAPIPTFRPRIPGPGRQTPPPPTPNTPAPQPTTQSTDVPTSLPTRGVDPKSPYEH